MKYRLRTLSRPNPLSVASRLASMQSNAASPTNFRMGHGIQS